MIGPGAIIEILRSGDVIPYCTNCVKHACPDLPSEDVFGEYHWTVNNAGKHVDIVVNSATDEMKIQQLVHFASTLGVANLGEGSIRSVYDEGFTTIRDLCEMQENHWTYVIGSNGSKIFNSFHNCINNIDSWTFAAATGLDRKSVV